MNKLNKSDVLFLLSTLQLKPDLRKELELIADTGGRLSDDVSDELRDLCSDCLDDVGFDENYEPTKKGKKLELLIDKLYID